jgi:nitrogenase molybdenum-iron protein alpha/beta subunit
MTIQSGRNKGDFTKPYKLPYQLGVYLAVNAVSDLYAVIDGPDCLFRKAEWVHGKHDLMSSLLDVLGRHRIVSSLVNAEAVVKDRGERLAARIRQVNEIPGARGALVCSMPHVMIIGTQYDRILRALEDEVSLHLMEVPSLSLQGEWVDGYVESLAALARRVDLSHGEPDPRRIAVIGYLHDRNEADHAANVEELRRLFGAIGLDVACIWLSGGNYDELAQVGDAATLVAFPLGRKAAHILGERTGAKVIEVDTPFGPTRTRRMLRKVAEATGFLDAVEPFLDRELRQWVPRFEWIVPHLFFGKRVAFGGAPDLLGGMFQIATELGMEVAWMASSTARSSWADTLPQEFPDLPPILFAPSERQMYELSHDPGAPIDLLVGDSVFADFTANDSRYVSLGFPSHHSHAIFDRPHLGIRGWACIIDRMAEALGRTEREAHRGAAPIHVSAPRARAPLAPQAALPAPAPRDAGDG